MTTSEESRSLPFKLLNRDNFSEWKASMESALCEKELCSYVEDAGGDVKHVKNASARGYIMRRIEHQQREHVKPGLNAHGVWRALCDAHEKQGPQTELRFFNTLMATRYVDGTRMEDHLSTMKELFDRLHALGSPFREHIRASMILSTLPHSWSAIAATQTALVSDSNPLTVASVSHVLLEEQTRRATAAQRAQHIESAAALLVSASSSTQSRASRKKCTWCLHLNHTEDECRGKAAGKPRRLPSNVGDGGAHVAVATSNFVFTATHAPVSVDGWVIDSGAGSLLQSSSDVHGSRAGQHHHLGR